MRTSRELLGSGVRKRERIYPQYAALPIKAEGNATKALLITSRETGRWIIPKGWPERGMEPHEVAAMEAYEEAGISGEIGPAPVASYHYRKRLRSGRERLCRVGVFLLQVKVEFSDWPERQQRQREWYSIGEAALRVEEAELADLLLSFSLHDG